MCFTCPTCKSIWRDLRRMVFHTNTPKLTCYAHLSAVRAKNSNVLYTPYVSYVAKNSKFHKNQAINNCVMKRGRLCGKKRREIA